MDNKQLDNALTLMGHNVAQLSAAVVKAGGVAELLQRPEMKLTEFLNTCARNGIEIKAKYVGQQETPKPNDNSNASAVEPDIKTFAKVDYIKITLQWDVAYIAKDGDGRWYAYENIPTWNSGTEEWQSLGLLAFVAEEDNAFMPSLLKQLTPATSLCKL